MPPGASLLAQGSERRAQRSNLHRREQDSGTYWGGGGGVIELQGSAHGTGWDVCSETWHCKGSQIVHCGQGCEPPAKTSAPGLLRKCCRQQKVAN